MTRKMNIGWSALAIVLLACGGALAAEPDLEQLEQQTIQAAVARVAPSVVRVQPIGGLEKVGRTTAATGASTGLVVAADGWIISSAYAFIQKPTSVLVTLGDGTRLPAKIVARDHSRMLVLLKVKPPKPLPVPEAVPLDQLAVGQWTIAVGRSLSEKTPNVSVGILSALGRIWGKAVQTDAKVSYVNYGGPLIDIRGRVIGVLVPLSPMQQTEVAGTEWYDSGIGFAVPLVDILARLDTLKKGVDLKPGILGVSLEGTNMYADPAKIAACPPKSPARVAGLRPGDTIVELDGMKIDRQAQLRHALGPHMAGDTVHVIAVRGKDKKKIAVDIKLAAEVEPYVRPFLGILPMRNPSEQPGTVVRFVYPNSPAAKAGLQAGDRIVGIGKDPVPDSATLAQKIAAMNPNDRVELRVVRAGKERAVSVTLGKQPTVIPEKLPAASAPRPTTKIEQPQTGIVEIKIPEEPNACVAYVPDNYDSRLSYGLIVWLPVPGSYSQEKLLTRWKKLCADNGLIVLVPQPRDAKRWSILEVEFVRKAIDDLRQHYSIDPARIVAHGYQVGGAVAYLVAFSQRDVVRGVAVVDAPLPGRVATATTEPSQPLAIYSVAFKTSSARAAIEIGIKRLEKRGFGVVAETLPGASRYLNADELIKLVRWVDTLDRI